MYSIHCYQNKRGPEMYSKFKRLGLENKLSIHAGEKREDQAASIWRGHIEMINMFYNATEDDFGIFCEDDIIIRKDFNVELIIDDFKKMELDLLLIGFLCENPINTFFTFPEKSVAGDLNLEEKGFVYLEYPDDTWGAQMYMLSRVHAKVLLEKYYDKENLSADAVITQTGNRALLYPLLVIEDGKSVYDDYWQMRAHNACFQFSFREGLYIE